MNGDDVGVIESGRGLCFLFKARQAVAIGSELGRQSFERYLTAEPGVFGEIDLAHSTTANQPDNTIWSIALSDMNDLPGSRRRFRRDLCGFQSAECSSLLGSQRMLYLVVDLEQGQELETKPGLVGKPRFDQTSSFSPPESCSDRQNIFRTVPLFGRHDCLGVVFLC